VNVSAYPYYIVKFEPAYLEPLVALVADKAQPAELRLKAMKALRAVADAQLPELAFPKIKALAERLESDYTEDDSARELLTNAYAVIAASGTPDALEFLKQRASFEYWAGRPMPKKEGVSDGVPGSPPFTWTAQGAAIMELPDFPGPQGYDYLDALALKSRYAADPGMQRFLEMAHQASPAWRDQRRIRQALEWRDQYRGVHPAPEIPFNPNQFQSDLYPPFPLVGKMLIGVILVSLGWWFWHERKTWPT
jgi:hypothetical protein